MRAGILATRDAFGQICQRVCEQQGWDLLPSGVRVPCESGRYQLVSLEYFEFEKQELVRLHTTIGQTRALGEERMVLALQINARLAHGALALRDGELVMIDTLMLKDADPAEVEASLSYLALTADYYEKMLFGTDDH